MSVDSAGAVTSEADEPPAEPEKRGFATAVTVLALVMIVVGLLAIFILSLGAFISVSFATRSLEVAVSSLGARLRERGWPRSATTGW